MRHDTRKITVNRPNTLSCTCSFYLGPPGQVLVFWFSQVILVRNNKGMVLKKDKLKKKINLQYTLLSDKELFRVVPRNQIQGNRITRNLLPVLAVVKTLPDTKMSQTHRVQDGKKCMAGKHGVAKVDQERALVLK